MVALHMVIEVIKEGCARSLAGLVHLASETIQENDESVRIQEHLMQPAQAADTHDIKTSPLFKTCTC